MAVQLPPGADAKKVSLKTLLLFIFPAMLKNKAASAVSDNPIAAAAAEKKKKSGALQQKILERPLSLPRPSVADELCIRIGLQKPDRTGTVW
jgi:hypothetical protein